MRIGAGAQLHDPAVHVPPEELLLSRHAEGLPDQPVRPADQRRRLARPARRHADRHRAGPPRGGHRQDAPTSADGGRIHGSDYSLVDYNRAGVPLVEIVSRPDIRTAEQARQYVTELRGILARRRRVRREDGGGLDARRRQRQRAQARRRRSARAARSRTSTACARSAGPSSTRRGARSTCSRPASAVRQETRHWDESDGRTHTLRIKEDADDYRYFPEPDLVPLAPSAEWIDACARRAADAAGRAPRPAGRGDRRGRRQRGGDGRRRPWPGRLRARRRRGRRRRRPGARPRQGGVAADSPSVPAADLAALTTLEVGGKLTATQAKAVLAELVANGGGDAAGDRRGEGLRGDGRRRARAARRPGDRRERRGVGEVLRRRGQGDGRARRRSDEASQGKADGKAVTALLNATP